MTGKTKLIVIALVIFSVLYFSGLGSVVGSSFLGGTDPFDATYVDRINYKTESLETVPDSNIVSLESLLRNSEFRFDNGTFGPIGYFYGGKATNIDPLTGLSKDFNTFTTETQDDGSTSLLRYGLDCSGYVSYLMWLSGYKSFPEGSSNQSLIGSEITVVSELETGDLAFMLDSNDEIIHVGMIINNYGTMYVSHCTRTTERNGIYIDELVYNDGYTSTYGDWNLLVANPYVY